MLRVIKIQFVFGFSRATENTINGKYTDLAELCCALYTCAAPLLFHTSDSIKLPQNFAI